MTLDQLTLLVALLAVVTVPAQAEGGAADARAPKRVRTHTSPRPDASGRDLSAFIKGSPAQQDLERRDNDLAGFRAIDHRKDAFFSDWRGLR